MNFEKELGNTHTAKMQMDTRAPTYKNETVLNSDTQVEISEESGSGNYGGWDCEKIPLRLELSYFRS